MIVVHTSTGVHEYPDATRFSTEDQYNNLCIWAGPRDDDLLAVFADGKWVGVESGG